MNIVNYGMCALIIGAGLFFLYLMTENKKILTRVQLNLASVAVKEGGGTRNEAVDADGKLHVSRAEATVYDLAAIEENRRDFNTAYADYVRNGQLIALLPLLGILGTVLGLIIGRGSADIERLMSGLGTAMWTTFLGLLFSIVLKFYDAWVIGVLVNAIDADFASKDAIIERQALMQKAAAVRKNKPAEAPK